MKTYALLLCESTERGYLPKVTVEFSTDTLKGPGELSLILMDAANACKSLSTENGHAMVKIKEKDEE